MDVRHLISDKKIKNRNKINSVGKIIFQVAGLISALLIVLIIFFIMQKGLQPFLPSYGDGRQNLLHFLSGTKWRVDQGNYGVLFITINTLISAAGAIILAFPISVLTALFIVKIAPKFIQNFFKTVVEILAAVPSVVYGVFAVGVIVDLVDNLADFFGAKSFGGNSMLATILLLAIMIFPTITSLSIVAIESVDKNLELASLALGASRTQTNFKVVLTSAKSGIFAGLVLGLGRAFGEATAVSMVAGNAMTGPTFNPFGITRTLTSTMLTGLKETTGVDYDIRFSVGIVLMGIIILTNILINIAKRKIGGVTYAEKKKN